MIFLFNQTYDQPFLPLESCFRLSFNDRLFIHLFIHLVSYSLSNLFIYLFIYLCMFNVV